MVEEGARHIYTFEMDKLIINPAEDALSYSFQIGYEKVIGDLKHSSFHYWRGFHPKLLTVVLSTMYSNKNSRN